MTKLLLTLALTLTLALPAGPAPGPSPAAPGPPPSPAAPAPPRPPGTAGDAGGRPLPAPLTVVRWWDPPPTPYAAGHRGVDLAAPVGTEVRAVGPGRVHYAGQVAGRGVLSLTLPNGLRTTYEPVRPLVAEGAEVTTGQVVALLTEGRHCPRSCLHWGLLRAEAYLNPLALLPRPAPRLLPLAGIRGPGPERDPDPGAEPEPGRISPGRPAGPSPPPRP
ncbi:M23 family metallopeptidase [Streptomyces sp. TBY4]|uniref:M23 family metallopeptidase n=1 Tax=Streptomyces sp. TBY4 TaxID=2962030 RepID=UPI0020B82A20|nr:M23 family metallopeptidase [Streptomyces sp. TBY4]MCP3758613.1 M23 family metallopeptidase [Streptomyces sp. TBY4]